MPKHKVFLSINFYFERMFIMKTKKIIAALLAGVLGTTAVVSASAATLTNENPDCSTEITARIEGAGPGDVSYVITIPDKVDFGTLTQPETETDSYKYIGFLVVATQLNFEKGAVSVYVKDSAAADGQFYIKQKDVENPFTISYDAFERVVDDTNREEFIPMNQSGDIGEYGYHLCSFAASAEGSKQDVTLALNQKQLYAQNLDEIAGDYSGTMTFHSDLTTITGE